MDNGVSQITTEAIRRHFPTRVGDVYNTRVPLEEWARSRCQWAIDVFNGSRFLDKREAAQASPFIRNLSQDFHETALQEQQELREITEDNDDIPRIGEIRLFPYKSVPSNWLACDGRVLQIAEYETLFRVLGAAYGGDGQTDFALPNITVPFQSGQNQGHYCIAVGGVYPKRG
jgi:hypothetical protein